jgi:hypothetical protein
VVVAKESVVALLHTVGSARRQLGEMALQLLEEDEDSSELSEELEDELSEL